MLFDKLNQKKKIVLSSLLLKNMNSLKLNYNDLKSKEVLEKKKVIIRNNFAIQQERFSKKEIDYEKYDKICKNYSLCLEKIELQIIKLEKVINNNRNYYKRLEIVYRILNGELDNESDLIEEYIDALKLEAIDKLEKELGIARISLYVNNKLKCLNPDSDELLTKNEELLYTDTIFHLNNELKELKVLLNKDNIDNNKKLTFSLLVNTDPIFILKKLYHSNFVKVK